jgi:hypothetical protein
MRIPTQKRSSSILELRNFQQNPNHKMYVYLSCKELTLLLATRSPALSRFQSFQIMHVAIIMSLFAVVVRNGLCQTNRTSAIWCQGLESCGHDDNICCEDVMVDGVSVHTYCEAMPSLPFQFVDPVDSICCPFGEINCGGSCCGSGKTCEYTDSNIVVGGLKARDGHIPPQARGLFPPISGGQWQCLDQPILP